MYKLHVEREIACSHILNLHDGKCHNLHGHNYKVIVDIKANKIQQGDFSSDGMLVDFGHIKRLIDNLDHKHLNDYFEEEAKKIGQGSFYELCRDSAIQPTTERLCTYIAKIIISCTLIAGIRVRIFESSNNYVEYSDNYYNI